MLSDDFELNISEEAAGWVEQAHLTDDAGKKISLLRKAVQLDPKSGYAVHMLGATLIQNGQREEGITLARKAVEVDPEYMFAYANLALLETQEDEPDVELARGYIAKILKAPVVTEQTAFLAHVASMFLAFDLEEIDIANREFEIASSLRPDDPMLDGWEERLKMAEVFSGGFFADFQKQSRERAHKKTISTKLELDTTSETTLNSLTRETLAEVARFWNVTTYGRKAVLIANISREMQDQAVLDRAIEKLSADEKNALEWVLENGGIRSFQAFSEKWGNDIEESPYWQYHKPKTVMGRLRMSALLAKGTLAGEQVLFIPADIRPKILYRISKP
jgi:tetratricopeptide (TPR) repeat protein